MLPSYCTVNILKIIKELFFLLAGGTQDIRFKRVEAMQHDHRFLRCETLRKFILAARRNLQLFSSQCLLAALLSALLEIITPNRPKKCILYDGSAVLSVFRMPRLNIWSPGCEVSRRSLNLSACIGDSDSHSVNLIRLQKFNKLRFSWNMVQASTKVDSSLLQSMMN